ncbi:tRNA (adenine57-N1/adenine58-N1)-methyltransferase [Nesterenkonia xinjiangensis]|uniref:tRNA (Adenine57-N1/adenine58-N1)-methyltransferase n=2 Tax=Nesterenkonia xinjiangensis TaxID=225327 RepID=A0A7Z0KAZ3_9MICC|nr:tRNA (adenine57-N1/adenine58-N1)-methyltransferase [Nesterenkonia xinjiangensis]
MSTTPESDPAASVTEGRGPVGVHMRKGPLQAGQRVQLTDRRGRPSTITLQRGGEWHTHQGVLRHDTLIGQPEGIVVANDADHQYQVLRPLLNDYVLSMPRGATVVYPKDSAQIVQIADVFPGAHVVEAGVGSGALSLSLLRAVGDQGTVHSYERREDFAEIARGNVEGFFGQRHPGWQVHVGDMQEQVPRIEAPGSVDRVVLDMLAPWECLDAVRRALAPGGVWVSYVATVTQLSRLAEAIRASGVFTEPEAHETMLRTWHLDGLAVRPDHRMVAHTGFLLSARRLADDQTPLQLKKREKQSEVTAEDMAAWMPEDAVWDEHTLKRRTVTGRKARKAATHARKIADAAREGDAVAPAEDAGRADHDPQGGGGREEQTP